MRNLLVILFVLALVVPLVALASERPAAGSLSIEEGSGVVKLRGQGGVLGRLGGMLQIVDLTPRDRWRPIVNGKVAKGPRIRVRGESISFRLLGGKFKIVLKGEEISLSARGRGIAVLNGDPNLFGYAGLYSTDADVDCIGLPEACEVVSDSTTKIVYGMPSESGKGGEQERDKESEKEKVEHESSERHERGESS